MSHILSMTSEEFKAARTRLGLTQEALAQKLGFSRQSIVRMEGGDAIMPTTAMAMQLLLAINCPANPIIKGDEQ